MGRTLARSTGGFVLIAVGAFILDSGVLLGAEKLLVSSFSTNRLYRHSAATGTRIDILNGGGALLEGGVHWVNLLAGIGGNITEVVAAQTRGTHDLIAPVEDSLELLARFENGSVGKMLHSWHSVNRIGGLGRSKIYGTEGNIAFESNGIYVLVFGKRKRLRFPGFLDLMGYRGMLRHFVDCVREGTEPRMSLALARRDMEIIDAAYRSLESGKFEEVGR